MKRICLLLVLLLLSFSCDDHVTFNSPSLEGRLDGTHWRASTYGASIDANGYLTISGNFSNDVLSLMVPSVALGTYILGDVTSIEARYETDGTTYLATNNGTLAAHLGDGKIVIEEISTATSPPTFTGTFWFNAYSTADNSINFNEGVFYKIPLISGSIPDPVFTCVDAQANSTVALTAYQEALDAQYVIATTFETTCAAYVAALETEKTYCGDLDGSIQATIDSLGDCKFTCDMAMTNSQTAEAEFQSASVQNYIASCNNYSAFLQEEIFYCGDPDGTIQTMIDALDCNDDDGDGVPNMLEDINGDGDYTNDDSDGDLNPDYLDDDDDDDLIGTADELMFDDDGNPLDTDGDGIADYLDNDDDGDNVLTIFEAGDTDGDGILDYLDNDDDGDSVLTIFENPDANFDGNPMDAEDTDGDMMPDYLDIDDDGDSVYTIYENPDPDANGDPNDAQNFDGDSLPDYLDADDDNDGMLTINENPDPNGDGNPDDAVNTDGDSAPDYLDAI